MPDEGLRLDEGLDAGLGLIDLGQRVGLALRGVLRLSAHVQPHHATPKQVTPHSAARSCASASAAGGNDDAPNA